MRILLIEDDAETASYLAEGLQDIGHSLSIAETGPRGLECATTEKWDLLIVDRMLPELDGVSLVRLLRTRGSTTPVLFLTTMDGVADRVAGLDAGGDDYLVKPFAFAELAARVAALGRRGPAAETILRVADLEMDLIARTVCRGGKVIDLQHREFQLLEYLLRHAGQIVTRSMLLKDVWNFNFDPKTNVVESHMSRLRAKIDTGGPDLIRTVRGTGYRIHAHP